MAGWLLHVTKLGLLVSRIKTPLVPSAEAASYATLVLLSSDH